MDIDLWSDKLEIGQEPRVALKQLWSPHITSLFVKLSVEPPCAGSTSSDKSLEIFNLRHVKAKISL